MTTVTERDESIYNDVPREGAKAAEDTKSAEKKRAIRVIILKFLNNPTVLIMCSTTEIEMAKANRVLLWWWW